MIKDYNELIIISEYLNKNNKVLIQTKPIG